MPDANELKLLASSQEQAFHEKFGYPAGEVPGIWVGQNVAVNMLGGRGGDRQLAGGGFPVDGNCYKDLPFFACHSRNTPGT